jgi:hypothetical protein
MTVTVELDSAPGVKGILPPWPYPGFRPFRKEEWPIFFGRERQIEALLALLAEHHFLCVHGPSGCGKSSLVEAGLLATLEREQRRLDTEWRTAICRPGANPLWNLACGISDAFGHGYNAISDILGLHSRLTRAGGSIARAVRDVGLRRDQNLLIVIDQFEELFRFKMHGNEQDARRFVDLLLGVFDQQPSGIFVAVAMRTDFLGDCASLIGLAEAVNAAPYLTPALTDAELRAAIIGPAELYNGKVDDKLTERMLAESTLESDRLPVLQHCLLRLWDKAAEEPGDKITHLSEAIYELREIGGVREALDRHADEVMASHDLAGLGKEVELAFRALTELDSNGRAIRRPLPWPRLLAESGAEDSRMQKVVRRFAAEDCGFLGRPQVAEPLNDDTIVDIAHEALIRRWRKLSGAHGATGAPNVQEGWLGTQERDERRYRTLLDRAREGRELIEPEVLDERLKWWQGHPRTPAWARRMSGERESTDQNGKADLALIDDLFARSVTAWRTNRRWRLSKWGLVAVLIGVLIAVALDDFIRTKKFAQANALLAARAIDDVDKLVKNIQTRNLLLQQVSALADKTKPAPQPPPVSSPDHATEVVSSTIPPAAPVADSGSSSNSACDGAIWIGSGGASNLRVVSGSEPDRVPPISEIRSGEEFVAAVPLRLRDGLPTQDNYQHRQQIGIVSKGAKLVSLGEPVSYPRPSGPQYWLKVRVPGQICAIVYFQYAGGTSEQASELSKALQERGYVVPGQEQLQSSAGLAEVRYYYSEDEESAKLLAQNVLTAAKQLGLAAGRQIRTASYMNWPRQKPPRGTLELWLDLSPS